MKCNIVQRDSPKLIMLLNNVQQSMSCVYVTLSLPLLCVSQHVGPDLALIGPKLQRRWFSDCSSQWYRAGLCQ